MDPFTFGIVATGTFGASLLLIATLEKTGFTINETLVSIVGESIKAGVILYFLKYVSVLFL